MRRWFAYDQVTSSDKYLPTILAATESKSNLDNRTVSRPKRMILRFEQKKNQPIPFETAVN